MQDEFDTYGRARTGRRKLTSEDQIEESQWSDLAVLEGAEVDSGVLQLLMDTISDNGISWYEFEQDVTDSWGGNDATDNTSAGFDTNSEQAEYSKAFDGTDDNVDTGTGFPTALGTTTWSISLWLNAGTQAGSDDSYLFGTYDGSFPQVRIGLYGSDAPSPGGLVFQINDGSNEARVTPSKTVDDQTWHHVVMVRDGDELRVYIDGSPAGSDTNSSVASDLEPPSVWIGARPDNSKYYEGLIDDWRIYNIALSDSEVSNLYSTDGGSGGGNPSIDTLATDGAWTFFGQPYAIYQDSKTFVGYIDSTGDIEVASIDHSTGSVTASVLDSGFLVDDHASPTLHIRSSDQRVMAFWDRGTETHYAISDDPLDVSSFGAVQTIATNSNYASPIQLPGESGRIYLFYRGGGHDNHRYVSTDDGGSTWSSPTAFVTRSGDRRIYTDCVREGDNRIHFVLSNHPRDSDHDPPFNIWYCYYENGSWYQADGTLIADESAGDLPMAMSDLDLVYDWSLTGNNRAWLHDIAFESDGTPVILFATFPSDTDHRYQHARWDGSGWVVNEITAAGTAITDGSNAEDQYSGGLVFDKSEPSRIWFSEEVNTDQYEIREATTADNGSTWNITEVTFGSDPVTEKNVRPQYVYNESGETRIVFMRGEYNHYTDYNTEVMSYNPQ